jgi:hypothetical protein
MKHLQTVGLTATDQTAVFLVILGLLQTETARGTQRRIFLREFDHQAQVIRRIGMQQGILVSNLAPPRTT